MCVAVHRNFGGSKGTLDYVRRATRAGIQTHLIESEEATPRRLSDADSRVADVPKKRGGHDQKGTRNSDLGKIGKISGLPGNPELWHARLGWMQEWLV